MIKQKKEAINTGYVRLLFLYCLDGHPGLKLKYDIHATFFGKLLS